MTAKPSPARIKRWIARSVERERTKRETARIRQALKDVRERRRRLITQARAQCKTLKERTRARVKDLRAKERERVNREVARMRQEARNRCAARIATIRAGSGKAAQKQRDIRRERAQQARELAAAKQREQVDRSRITAAERRAESDDAVRQNLPPHLIPIFNQMARHIKGKPGGKMTRTEEFLHWAEENPEMVESAAIERAERETAKLIREQKKALREEQRARRMKAATLRKVERDEAAAQLGRIKPKPPRKVRLGMREAGALAIAHEAWKDRKGWADFDDPTEKRAVLALRNKGLVEVRDITARGREGQILSRTRQAQMTAAGLDVVAGAVPF